MTANKDLAGLPILLTRPEGQAEEWQLALSNLGAIVRHIPTLAIHPLPTPADLPAMLEAAHMGIFVSGNAVRALAAEPTATSYSIRWYAVGQATEQLAAASGFHVTTAGAYNSESLLQHADLQAVNNRRCIIVRGRGGRKTLGETLLARGALVNYCEMYRRDCASQNAPALAEYLHQLADNKPHVISAGSVETLDYTLTLAEQAQQAFKVRQGIVLVPGERVAKAARERGLEHVLQAPSMQLADIVYILKKWWAEQQ